MKKSAKGIIALVAVLAVLGGVFAGLKLTEPENPDSMDSTVSDDTSSDTGDSVVLISDGEDGTVERVDVQNKLGELHAVVLTEKTEDSAATYTLEGYEDLNLNTSVVGTLANNANDLTSSSLIAENCTELEKYGLAEPYLEFTVIYKSGKSVRMFVGDDAPTGGQKYVMVDDGNNNVYTVADSYLANYDKTTEDFVKSTIVESPEGDSPTVESVRIERENLDYDIYLEHTDKDNTSGGTSAEHIMKEPTEAFLAIERSQDITDGIFGLSSSGIYSIHCDESDIAQAGLKEPFCRVTVDCGEDGEYILLLSEPFTDSDSGRCCYAMLEGGNVIYIVKAENAKWVDVMPIDIASRIFIANYVWDITDLKVESKDGQTAEFSIEKKEQTEETTSSEDSEETSSAALSADDFNVTLNGEEFDAERYRQFYSFLISGSAEEFALDVPVPDTEPLVRIEYTDSSDGTTRVLEFYEYSNLTVQIVIDGESKFFTEKSYVETIIENMSVLGTDEDLKTTWK